MAAAGTLIGDLDAQPPLAGNDGDFVQAIFQDMNQGAGLSSAGPQHQQQRAIPPPLPAQMTQQQQFAAQPSTQGLTMDARIPTSHIIGNEHPSPADFAAAIGVGAGGQMMPGAAFQALPAQGSIPSSYTAPSKNLYGRILDEIKVPFVVALLFFVFSLPPIRVLFAHYVPSFIKPTGEFHVTGLATVAGIVGLSFWFLHRVIAPLLSL